MGWLDFLFGDKNQDRDGSAPEKAMRARSMASDYEP